MVKSLFYRQMEDKSGLLTTQTGLLILFEGLLIMLSVVFISLIGI